MDSDDNTKEKGNLLGGGGRCLKLFKGLIVQRFKGSIVYGGLKWFDGWFEVV